jgi:hypothetical protein
MQLKPLQSTAYVKTGRSDTLIGIPIMDSPGKVFTMLQPAGIFQSIIVELRF